MSAFLRRHLTLRTILKIVIACVVLAIAASYVLFQGRHLIAGPVIRITEDHYDGTSPSVELAGTADNITALTLNGRPIYTDDGGAWSETVVLPVGYTVVMLEAEDRYGRTESVERAYVRRAEQ